MGFYRPKPKLSLAWLIGVLTVSAFNFALAKVGLGIPALAVTLGLLLYVDFTSEKIRFALAMVCLIAHTLLAASVAT